MARKKILLVDDSKTALVMEQLILKKGPYDIVVAGDGVEGYAKAQSEHPDLIVLDVVMPKMDGLQTLRELKRNEDTQAIPVIMLTTRGEGPNVAAGFEGGCAGYLTKPVDAVALLKKIREQIGE